MKRFACIMSVALVALAPIVTAKAIDDRAIVTDFVDRFYTKHDVAGAFAAHVAPDYIQHNPGLPDGPKAAVDALAPMFARPDSRFEVKHLLIDGDLALVHLFGQGKPGTPGAAVADLYRLKGGKVVEHWDVLQLIEPGSDPMAMAPAAPAAKDATTRNRAAFDRFIALLFGKGDVDGAYRQFVASDLIQHNSRMGQGRDAAIAAIKGLRSAPGATFAVQRTLVDGDLAAVHYRGKLSVEDRGAAVVEIFRFDKGRIVEHWDMFQPAPETSRNAHPMF
ncbi:nuclear transport factor 2 family protein [Sphingomonas bisphenolicum]|uniref:Polyketide cyclase n=1 Tax=Sphingomonas bisphenolicum TaxID=296544 RepID=A0ABM7GA71_9SPHN|nr:nuclear transport factor 2 family protein [Sphingomonas bisphenolicum]BBF71970.1 polyketide cyclase [Sphingomonas bisphenolicum]